MFEFAVDYSIPERPYVVRNAETSEVLERTDDPNIAAAALAALRRQAGVSAQYQFFDATIEEYTRTATAVSGIVGTLRGGPCGDCDEIHCDACMCSHF